MDSDWPLTSKCCTCTEKTWHSTWCAVFFATELTPGHLKWSVQCPLCATLTWARGECMCTVARCGTRTNDFQWHGRTTVFDQPSVWQTWLNLKCAAELKKIQTGMRANAHCMKALKNMRHNRLLGNHFRPRQIHHRLDVRTLAASKCACVTHSQT